MHITRVELTNIKSYEYAVIRLRGGVTAIRGHNGAGKSTVLEAIGWVLFDHLPYKQKSFVREGANSGKALVAFISPLDEREYEVTRKLGTSAEWFIHDPQTGTRIESNADVIDFLKRHMRIDGSFKLDELFAGALGTPQGLLTADFLLTPAQRKLKFDRLLQVEDYGDAAKKLNETAKYLREQEAAQDVRIAGLEHDVAQFDDWRRDHEKQTQAQLATALELEALAGALAQAEAAGVRLLAAKADVMKAEGVANVAASAHTAAQERQTQVARLLDESRAAAQTLEQTRADHDAYLRAGQERAQAVQQMSERDRLNERRHQADQRRASAVADASHARDRLEQVAQAERQILTLLPDVDRYDQLEKARDTASQNARRLKDTRVQLADARAERESLEPKVAARARELAEVEAARPLAVALAERRLRVEALQALAAQQQQRERRRADIASERAQVAAERAQAVAQEARQAANVRRLEDYRPLVERIPALTAQQEEADTAARQIETRLEQHRQAREQSGMGLCPFLREPCQNIRQRGENSLATYFDRLISADEVALAPAVAGRKAANKRLDDARKAEGFYLQLDTFRDQARRAKDDIESSDAKERRLAAELDEIERALALASDAAELDTARRLLRESEAADKRLATVDGLRRELDTHRERLRKVTDAMATFEATCAELADAPEAERAASAELERLGRPRERMVECRAIVGQKPEAERALTTAQAAVAEGDAKLAALDVALAPFAALAEELAALDATLKRTQPGHTRHLQHQRAAEQLGERDRDHAAAVAAEAATAHEERLAADALKAARATFDPQALDAAQERANALRSHRGELLETQRHIEEELRWLGAQIAQGEQRLVELESARVERDDLRDTQKMLDQFRELIKAAGPRVTQRMLAEISAQANAIFGEIIGDRAAELSWQKEYEIVLKRGINERSFALLSGGEQMAAALATRLALLRRLTGLDLAFFDEPTQNMDTERRNALAEQIRRVRGFDQLIVISHDDTFEQGLDSVIHLEKRGGTTQVRDDEAAFATPTPFGVSLDGDGERVMEQMGESLRALFVE